MEQDLDELSLKINEAVRELRKVDLTVPPSDYDLMVYESLLNSAHDLVNIMNHIMNG